MIFNDGYHRIAWVCAGLVTVFLLNTVSAADASPGGGDSLACSTQQQAAHFGLLAPRDSVRPQPLEFLTPVTTFELAQGFIGSDQAYAGTVQFARLFKVMEGRLRLGPTGGALFTSGNVEFMGGLRVAFKLKELYVMKGGITWGNLQLRADVQWATTEQILPGIGLEIEALERLSLGARGYLTVDPNLDSSPGWLMLSLGFNLNKFFAKKGVVAPNGVPVTPIGDPTGIPQP